MRVTEGKAADELPGLALADSYSLAIAQRRFTAVEGHKHRCPTSPSFTQSQPAPRGRDDMAAISASADYSRRTACTDCDTECRKVVIDENTIGNKTRQCCCCCCCKCALIPWLPRVRCTSVPIYNAWSQSAAKSQRHDENAIALHHLVAPRTLSLHGPRHGFVLDVAV